MPAAKPSQAPPLQGRAPHAASPFWLERRHPNEGSMMGPLVSRPVNEKIVLAGESDAGPSLVGSLASGRLEFLLARRLDEFGNNHKFGGVLPPGLMIESPGESGERLHVSTLLDTMLPHPYSKPP